MQADIVAALPTGTNSIGTVNTNQVNFVSTDNSTTTPLGIDAVFTGTGEDITKYTSISIVCLSDQDSATGGLSIEYSSDNSNWDLAETHTITANTVFANIACAHAKWFRIVYTNGGTGQGFFRLSVLLSQTPAGGHLHLLSEDIGTSDFAILVHSVIAAQLPSGAFTSIGSTTGGNLKMSVQEISDGLDIGAGNAGSETQRISIATDDVNLASINTDAGTIAGAVAAGQMQVDIVAALPAGTNNIGDVDVLTVPAPLSTTGGGTEATAQRVTLANDSTGVLSVDDNGGSLTVDNGGTFVVQEDGAALTALQLIDDSIFADDAAFALTTSKVTISGAIRDDTLSSLAAAEGDAIPLRTNSTGALHVTGGGGGTEYTEDVTTANPQVGTATMMERDDALSGVTPVEGDWIGLRGSAEGALWTQDFNSDAILADMGTVAGAVAGAEMQVDIVTQPLPSGAATSAAQLADGHNVAINAALPAGTNAIGKLAANSGIDIGDVDVTSLPGSMSGPGEPAIDSYTQVAINLTTGANQVLASSAANKQIWVYGYMFTCGDADGQSVSFQDEDDVALSGIMEFGQYGGASVAPSGNFSMPIWKLGTDKDLEVDITSGDVDGWLVYAIVSV